MRTDTKTFEKRAFAMVRALGINSVRSKQVASRIVSGLRHGASFMYGGGTEPRTEIDSIELELSLRGSFQSVNVHVDGAFLFGAQSNDGKLVSFETTREQELLERPMFEATIALYQADDAERPAMQAAYDALRDRMLALNPFAHAARVDPALHECYSDVVKSEDGRRPRGHVTVDECRRYLLRRQDGLREAA